MAKLPEILRDGSWLNAGRVRLWAAAVLIASAAGLVYLVATSDGLMDFRGRPLGTDFSNVYAAGSYVLEGNAAAAFDPRLQHAREIAIFGAKTPFYGWHYPPFFLWIAAVLALMPYWLALIVWQVTTLFLYLWMVRTVVARTDAERGSIPTSWQRETDRGWLLLALAFPAVFVNLGHGHNGFLTAALIGLALAHLDARPALSGVLFGLLAYKPQFGLMIPLVLLATGRWRTLLAAGATCALLVLAATLSFGTQTWRAFFTFAEYTRVHVLETGETGWHKIQSVFSWARMWGAPVPLAYAVQSAVTLLVAGALAWLWRSRADFGCKAAALCIGAMLATPYSLDYDLMALAPAIAFLAVRGVRRGFAPYEITLLAALWGVPLVARGIAEVTLVPLGVIAMLATFLLILRQARMHPAPPELVPAHQA
jgi:hypothetical protein